MTTLFPFRQVSSKHFIFYLKKKNQTPPPPKKKKEKKRKKRERQDFSIFISEKVGEEGKCF